jgi:hypothetical protein
MSKPSCTLCQASGNGVQFPLCPASAGYSFGEICAECDEKRWTVEYTAEIDLDTSAQELAEQWRNGNCNAVIRALQGDHPGLTALLIVQLGPCCGEGYLSADDCRRIANRLIDNRAERCM